MFPLKQINCLVFSKLKGSLEMFLHSLLFIYTLYKFSRLLCFSFHCALCPVFLMQNLTQCRVGRFTRSVGRCAGLGWPLGWFALFLPAPGALPLIDLFAAAVTRPLSVTPVCLCIARHARFKDNEDGMQEARQIFTQLDDLDKEDMNMNHKDEGGAMATLTGKGRRMEQVRKEQNRIGKKVR